MSAHYSQQNILSQRICYYNKHFQIVFGTYIQASQVNVPNNTNHPSALDGIYLCPVPNLYGGHQIMDLLMGQLITRSKLSKIPNPDFVINTD